MSKTCTKCRKVKPLSEFHKGKDKDGYRYDCKACVKQASQTKVRVLTDSFNHQVRSCTHRGYQQPIYTKDELVKWGLNNPEFHILYEQWKSAGYHKSLKPSIDRINDYISYTFDNIQFVTFSVNQQNYYQNTIGGKTTKKSIAVDQLNLDGEFIKRFPSIQLAGRELNIPPINIQRCCTGKPVNFKRNGKSLTRVQKTAGGFKWRYSLVPNDNSEQI